MNRIISLKSDSPMPSAFLYDVELTAELDRLRRHRDAIYSAILAAGNEAASPLVFVDPFYSRQFDQTYLVRVAVATLYRDYRTLTDHAWQVLVERWKAIPKRRASDLGENQPWAKISLDEAMHTALAEIADYYDARDINAALPRFGATRHPPGLTAMLNISVLYAAKKL